MIRYDISFYLAAYACNSRAFGAKGEAIQNRNIAGVAQYGLSGIRYLQGSIQKVGNADQMSGIASMDRTDNRKQDSDIFLKVGNIGERKKTPFWLDVVPGV